MRTPMSNVTMMQLAKTAFDKSVPTNPGILNALVLITEFNALTEEAVSAFEAASALAVSGDKAGADQALLDMAPQVSGAFDVAIRQLKLFDRMEAAAKSAAGR